MICAQKTIRVLCVDDHAFVVEGLRARLKLAGDMEVVGSLATTENLAQEVRRLRPDVVLLDISLPGPDAFEALEDVKRLVADARVIMLSAHVRDHYIDAAAQAGASGYLSKNDEPEAIVQAIRRVARGEFVYSTQVTERCANKRAAFAANPHALSKWQTLTSREQQILRLIGRGLTRGEIARTLCRSAKTIDAHRFSIMSKVDIHDSVELALYAVREGLVEA